MSGFREKIKHPKDGQHVLDLYQGYMEFLQSRGSSWPAEVRLTAMNIIVSDTRIKTIIKTIILLANHLFSKKNKSITKLPEIDALIFISSDKPSFSPALNSLAENILERNLSCGILSYNSVECRLADGTLTTQPLNSRFPSETFLNKFNGLVFAAAVSTAVLANLFLSRRELFFHLLKRASTLVYEIYISRVRSKACHELAVELNPKIFVTHIEKVPVANEMISELGSTAAKRILFLCEHPDTLIHPIASDEVWVWNHVIASEIVGREPRPSYLKKIAIEVVGHHESDRILAAQEREIFCSELETIFHPDKKIFIFISEYLENTAWDRGPITRLAVGWIKACAELMTDWQFVIKTRPYHSMAAMPGFDTDSTILPTNVSVYRGGLGLYQIFASGRVAAAGATGSLGLFAAARSGIPGYRFVMNERHMEMRFLDELTVVVNAPEQLAQHLTDCDKHRKILHSKVIREPYRGRSLERMTDLVLRDLNIST